MRTANKLDKDFRHKNYNSLDPQQGLVIFSINRLQIFDGQFLAQHSLVERKCKTAVDKLPMVQGLQVYSNAITM